MKQRLEDMNWREPPFSTRYRELADLEPYYAGNDGVPPGNIVVTHNICVRSQLLKTTWGANETMVESRNNFIDTDLIFTDSAGGDFRLKEDSPVYEHGFKWIPFDRIGRRKAD